MSFIRDIIVMVKYMKKRVISAIVALIIVVPLLILGGDWFYIGACVIGVIGFNEFLQVREKDKKIPVLIKCLSMAAFVILMMSAVNNTYIFKIDYRYLTLSILLCLLPLLLYPDRKRYDADDAFYLLGGVFFLGTAFNFLITIRNMSLEYFVYVMLVTFLTDTFAHFFGTKLGKIKLCPKISPNKTVEGALGGTFFGTFIGFMYFMTFVKVDAHMFSVIVLSFFLSIMAQFGDLFFSSVKRKYGVKDYGNIMPGHGGVLDRVDSLLFAMLAFTFAIAFF